MAVFCAQGELAFGSAARRDEVLADLAGDAGGRARWQGEAHRLVPGEVPAGLVGIVVEQRFLARADADAFVARLEAVVTGPRKPVAGSWVAVHVCSHDVGGPCPPGTVRAW